MKKVIIRPNNSNFDEFVTPLSSKNLLGAFGSVVGSAVKKISAFFRDLKSNKGEEFIF